jgi:hypothetical protein
MKVSDVRISELAGFHNKQGRRLIEKVIEEKPKRTTKKKEEK